MIPKFRAWLKYDKEMKNVIAFDTRGHSFLGIEGPHVTVDGWCDNFEVGKQAVLMQSTGLKDKNSVEIFEGDCFAKSFQMIEIPTGRTFLKDEIGVVKFIDGQFVCHIDGWGSAPLKDVLGYQNTNDDHWKDGLVIGNIWENPELLEQANEN